MDREHQRAYIRATLDLHRCPNTGKVVESMKSDDKVLCGCGKSNPRLREAIPGALVVHVKRFMEPASVDEYIAQRETRRAS